MQVLSKERQVYDSRWKVRRNYLFLKDDLFWWTMWSVFLWFLHPALAFVPMGIYLGKVWFFYEKYLAKKTVRDYYRKALEPRMMDKIFIQIGYEIDVEKELNEHLRYLKLLDSGDEKAKRYLKRMENLSRNGQRWRQVGLGRTQLTTHFWLIGTTGAGKTSLIMQLAKMLAEIGGGFIFVDGKADSKMFFKFYNIAKSVGREQDVYLINFLPVENAREHTNTFNPLANMSGPDIVEFFSTLKGQASGDQAYWLGRGKALLSPIANALYWRKKFLGENFTIPVLYSYISEFSKYMFLCVLFRLKAKAVEEILRQDKLMEVYYQKGKLKKGVVDARYPYLDAIVYHLTISPQERSILDHLGFSFEYLEMLWNTYNELVSYLLQLGTAMEQKLESITKLYEQSMKDVKQILSEPYEVLMQRWTKIKETNPKEFNFSDPQSMQMLQQHAYAQQQWTEIFSVLLRYSNIFGSLEPEVDPVDIIRNQKFLYVLLPPLKQSPATTELLGKLILTSLTKAIALALGGAVEGLTKEQRDILEKRLTAVPLGVFVLDEYGAYPIEGVETLLAQVRSINVSVWVSTQDYTSGRVEGNKESSARKMWANTQKIILRVKDMETLEFLEKVMPEVETIQQSYMLVDDKYIYEKTDASITKEKVFDVKRLQEFRNGAGVIITDTDVVVLQTYWADSPPADKINLNHSTAYR